MVFFKVGRCQETLCPQCWSRMGPQEPSRQGRRSCGPTTFACGCHTVVLMCTRDASFGAQLDEEESWTGMIAVMQHPLSSKSGAPQAAHRGVQGRSVVAGLVSAYRLSFRNERHPWSWPMIYETGIEMTESVHDDDYHGDDKGGWTRKQKQVLSACQADQLGGSADNSSKPVE